MKTLTSSIILLLVFWTPVHASFSVSEITQWAELDDLGTELKLLSKSATPDGKSRYFFSLSAPAKLKELPGQALQLISYWNSDRSTDIPIAMGDNESGVVGAAFQISERDIKEVSIVVRYVFPNTSAETGFRIRLQTLLAKKLEQGDDSN